MVTLDNRLIAVAAMVAALLFGVASPVSVLAQEATPEMAAAAAIANHIHTGTCEELGDVVATLAELIFADEAAGDMGTAATPMAAMTAESVPVAVSVTNVEMGLDEILAAPHAFNAHDPNDGSIYIACGDITGTPDEQGNLFVGVAEDNDSGLSGVVWLIDDGTGAGTVVTVFLVGPFESTAAPADEGATPVG